MILNFPLLQDEAGSYQAIPQNGSSWETKGKPRCLAHEYIRGGTAKLLTLFHPADGKVFVKGVESCTNAVLHPWLEKHLELITNRLPDVKNKRSKTETKQAWEHWQDALQIKSTLPLKPPHLRMLLVLDDLAGHKTPEFVLWLIVHGIMPLYTPISGSWLNMAESIQNIFKAHALNGHRPESSQEIIQWLEETASAWNKNPTPFMWGGKRTLRRSRARQRLAIIFPDRALLSMRPSVSHVQIIG